MANVDAPRGLGLIGHITGSEVNAAVNKYIIPSSDATATFVGDAVKSTGGASAEGIPYVIQAAATDPIRGVIVGFEADPVSLENKHRVASTERVALVCDDPDAIFEIQEDSDTSTLAAGDIGSNADIVVAAGSTTSGLSGMEIDSDSASPTDGQLRILRLVQRVDNEIGDNARYVVRINEHELNQVAGV